MRSKGPSEKDLWKQAEAERRRRNRTKFWRDRRYKELLREHGYNDSPK